MPDPTLSQSTLAPLVDGCDRYHNRPACPGSFRLVEQDGPVWIAGCDVCGGETGVPARSLDPQIRRDGLLARAMIPERFRGPFERTPENEGVLRSLRQWLGGFDAKEGAPSLLPAPALYGRLGIGKSHLLAATCCRIIEECDLPVAYCSTVALLRDLQRFDSDVIRGAAWERATTVDVLALDDLGAERGTDWQLDELHQLVNWRYEHELPILIATNYVPDHWEGPLDGRTASRLRQMTFALEVGGRDRRLDSQTPMEEIPA